MKKAKSFLLAGVMALVTISIASAKSFDIVVPAACKAGGAQLKAGEYLVKVEGNKATFTDVHTAKEYTVDVKLETNATKFGDTNAEYSVDGDTRVMKGIRLGGTTTKVNF
jgi:hypothetical protein